MIETERLLLRPFTADDAARLHAIHADPEVHRTLGGPPPPRDEFVAAWLARMRAHEAEHGFALLAAIRRMDGEMIGRAGLIRQEVGGAAETEVGYAFACEVWGQGYAAEAARASRDWGFTHLAVEHLVSLILPTNARSIRVARANGMRVWKEAEFRGFHVHVHRITRAEWNALPGPSNRTRSGGGRRPVVCIGPWTEPGHVPRSAGSCHSCRFAAPPSSWRRCSSLLPRSARSPAPRRPTPSPGAPRASSPTPWRPSGGARWPTRRGADAWSSR
jgi:RimJ/RimL family protein N-acetyltransferase